MKGNILEQLNDAQRKAVEYMDGPAMVIAGAGSGKTRVLTYKIAYLLEKGLAPYNILALTFTNKAAREMKARIAGLVGDKRARWIVMGTFHSVFSRILRAEAARIGFNGNFTIYDETDTRSLIKSIIKDLGLNDKEYKPSTVHNRISNAKNRLIMPDDYAMSRTLTARDKETHMPAIATIYKVYGTRCMKANAMDFDDLLAYTYALFRDNDDVRRKYADRFKYVLVDEYQDTNTAQQHIVAQLAADSRRICVVGDDAQSIYGFRGADIDNMLNFNKTFPGTALFKLERNYRSTQRIVQAANSLIKHNQKQIPKDIYSENDKGGKIAFKQAYSDKEEAIIVCHDIRKLRKKESYEYSDFAILYRTNAQSRSFEEAMRKDGIPYRIYGGLSFYQRKEIKDIIAYFRLVVNPSDEEALKRIINYPARGIGDATMAKVAAAAMQSGTSLWDIVCHPELHGLDISSATRKKLHAFSQLLIPYIERSASDDAYKLGTNIITGCGIYADLHSDKSPEAVARQENLDEILSAMQDFVESRKEEGRAGETSLSDYLQEICLLTDMDSGGNDDEPRVTLMTIHSAKGLEFPAVFIVGLEENILPNPQSAGSPRQIEEERRLLYVAMTRAEKHCILTCARTRFRYGQLEFGSPSRFLRDIDPALIDYETETNGGGGLYGKLSSRSDDSHANRIPYGRLRHILDDKHDGIHINRINESTPQPVSPIKVQTPSSPPRASSSNRYNVKAGDVIEHERFGIGEVLSVEGTGENTKAKVRFKNTGEKLLLLKFARFKTIA